LIRLLSTRKQRDVQNIVGTSNPTTLTAKTPETPQSPTFSHQHHNSSWKFNTHDESLLLERPTQASLHSSKVIHRPSLATSTSTFPHPNANQSLDLTGSAPAPQTSTTAGLSHNYTLTTKYYTATLPIWIDEIPSVSEWHSEFIKPEAGEVVAVLGAWIYCFRRPVKKEDLEAVKEALKAISEVIEKASYSGSYGGAGEAVCLAVAMPQSITPYLDMGKEEWEDVCQGYGFEYIDFEEKAKGGKEKNEFGEEVGVKRVEEALAANDWEGGDGEHLDSGEWEDEVEGAGLHAEEKEMGVEIFDLKAAIYGLSGGEDETGDGDQKKQVEELESMMRKMMAIKGMFLLQLFDCGVELINPQKLAKACLKLNASALLPKPSTTL
jgi:hypothetical protein